METPRRSRQSAAEIAAFDAAFTRLQAARAELERVRLEVEAWEALVDARAPAWAYAKYGVRAGAHVRIRYEGGTTRDAVVEAVGYFWHNDAPRLKVRPLTKRGTPGKSYEYVREMGAVTVIAEPEPAAADE